MDFLVQCHFGLEIAELDHQVCDTMLFKVVLVWWQEDFLFGSLTLRPFLLPILAHWVWPEVKLDFLLTECFCFNVVAYFGFKPLKQISPNLALACDMSLDIKLFQTDIVLGFQAPFNYTDNFDLLPSSLAQHADLLIIFFSVISRNSDIGPLLEKLYALRILRMFTTKYEVLLLRFDKRILEAQSSHLHLWWLHNVQARLLEANKVL